jgi:peptidyl-prolyl cis-trans isomerase B (cyclophilin B)
MTSKKKQQNLYSTAAKRMASYQEEQAQREAAANRKGFDLKVALAAIVISVAVAVGLQFATVGMQPDQTSASPSPSSTSSSGEPVNNTGAVPDKSLAEARTWKGNIQINDATLPVTLFGDKAPQAVASFVSLSQKGFFNGISCHRLTTAGIFVLQCGDPKGDGTGGPGYSFGPVENAPADNLYKKGYLAMARQGGNSSSMGSQFFIVYADSNIPSDAAGGYTVFGEVGGLESIQDIITAGTSTPNGDGQPKIATVIKGISVN